MGCVFGREARTGGAAAPRSATSARVLKDVDDLPSLSVKKSQAQTLSNVDGRVKALDLCLVEDNAADEDGRGEAGVVENSSGSLHQPTHMAAERKKPRANPRMSNPPKNLQGEQVAAGWPAWLVEVAGEAIRGLIPRRADTFQKLDKVLTCVLILPVSPSEIFPDL